MELTARELALLEVLLKHPQRVLSKAQLQEKLYDWSGGEPESNALEVHVHHLRRKIHPGIVRTVRGVGYALGRGEVAGVSLQRRLLMFLLLCAPVVWGVALLRVGEPRAARGQRAVRHRDDPPRAPGAGDAGPASASPAASLPPAPAAAVADGGEADLRDLPIAVWDGEGKLLLADREGVQLAAPRRTRGLRRPDARRGCLAGLLPAVGRRRRGWWRPASGAYERDELVTGLVGSQLLPWLLVLPVLLLAMAWAVRQALAPVRAADRRAAAPQRRRPAAGADDRSARPSSAAVRRHERPVRAHRGDAGARAPLHRRRRARAAHAAGRAARPVGRAAPRQRARPSARRPRQARRRPGPHGPAGRRSCWPCRAWTRPSAAARRAEVDWRADRRAGDERPAAARRTPPHRARLRLAGRRHARMPCCGDADLLAVLLRNLLDNAVRYAPAGSDA